MGWGGGGLSVRVRRVHSGHWCSERTSLTARLVAQAISRRQSLEPDAAVAYEDVVFRDIARGVAVRVHCHCSGVALGESLFVSLFCCSTAWKGGIGEECEEG